MSLHPSTSVPPDANPVPGQNGLTTPVALRGPYGAVQIGNGWGGPALGSPVNNAQPQQGFDIWGPLQRRKYLIALFCLIGAGLGYLYFVKTPKTYQSAIKLMITTQAPPIFADGDLQIKGASMPAHASLIASQLVLSQAVDAGDLGKLDTFKEIAYPVGSLKDMLKVQSDGNNSETMTISCVGPNPDDLPKILNQIVAAYRTNIDADSQNIGEESAQVFQELSSKLSNEIRRAEERSAELYNELGITTVSENGVFLNPYNQKLVKLLAQQDDSKSALRRLNDRLQLLEQSLQTKDEAQIQVVAIEAKKYLDLTRAPFETWDQQMPKLADELPGVRPRSQLETAQMKYIDELTDLGFEWEELSEQYGRGHSKIGTLERRIKYYQAELEAVEADLAAYETELQQRRQELAQSAGGESGGLRNGANSPSPDASPSQTPESGAGADSELADLGNTDKTSDETDLQTFRAQEDRHFIKMYGLALQREQQQMQLTLQQLGEEIENVSKQASDIAAGVQELNTLKQEIANKSELVRVGVDQLSEMNIVTKSFATTKVKVLDDAGRGYVVAPSLVKSLALGTMLAFLAGFGLAVLVDQSELSFRSPHEIAERLHIPVVGRIPRIDIRKAQKQNPNLPGVPTLVVAHNPGSTVAEAFRDIRTSLFFQSVTDDVKTILFTSPSPGDGKSTTCCNLALSIAQAGKKIVLVDADFRRPRVHQYFEEECKPGLLDVLMGETSLSGALRKSSVDPQLFLLTAGGRPKNPGELVTSVEFGKLILALREKFDYVLIDSPPVLPVSDPASIASLVDGVYMVTRIRKGVKITTQRAKETLDRVGARWMGIIINGYDENPHYSEYGYQYGYYSYHGGRYGRYYEANYKDYRDKITEK